MVRYLRLVVASWACVLVCVVACGRVTQSDDLSNADAGGRSGSASVAAAGAGGTPDGGDGGDGPPGAAGLPAEGQSAFKLSDDTVGYLELLNVASDRAGNALVVWTEGSTVHAARWDSGRARWLHAPELQADDARMTASQTGEFPLIASAVASAHDPKLFEVAARRFDFSSLSWSGAFPLPGVAWRWNWELIVDAAGTAHAYWRNPEGGYWSSWPVDSSGWDPAASFEEAGQLVAGSVSTFYWSATELLQVQSFDADSRSWNAPVELRDLTQESGLSTHVLITGREDAALVISNRRDPEELVVEAWRKEPGSDLWGAAETVMVIPVTTDPSSVIGPIGGVADPAGDFVWVPYETSDGSVDLSVARYDPEQGAWGTPRVLHGQSETSLIDLRLDDSGRAFGYSYAAGLLRFDPEARQWQDGPKAHADIVLASANGAFAIARDEDRMLAFKSDAGADWRPALGLPANARAAVAFVHVDAGLVGPERALLVWSGSVGSESGLWACFIE